MDSEETTPVQDAPVETQPALLPISLREAQRALVAVESGANREAIFARIESVIFEWSRALGEPGRVAMSTLARHERELRTLIYDFRERTFTRRDRHRAWEQYRATWDEITRQKEQASLAGKAHFLAEVEEIDKLLKIEGPRLALARLRGAQRERDHYLLSKQHADEVQQAFFALIGRIRDEAEMQSPARLRLEERARQARGFLSRVERAAQSIQYRVNDNRHQWDTEGNALRAALLKQQIADDEADLKRIQDKIAQVRKEIERLDEALKPRRKQEPPPASQADHK